MRKVIVRGDIFVENLLGGSCVRSSWGKRVFGRVSSICKDFEIGKGLG